MGERNYGGIMVTIFTKHLSLCALTTAILFFVQSVNAKDQVDAVVSSEAQAHSSVDGEIQNSPKKTSCVMTAFYRCNDGKRHRISSKTYQFTDEHNAEEAAINISENGTKIFGENITINSASNINNGSKKSFWKYGIMADKFGRVDIKEGVINFINGDAVYTGEEGHVVLNNVSIAEKGIQEKSIANDAKNSAFQMSQYGGFILFVKGNVEVIDTHAVSFQGELHYIDFFGSTVVVKGHESYGFHFSGEGEFEGKKESFTKERIYRFWGESELFGGVPEGNLPVRGNVYLYDTKFMVPNSTAIYSNKSGGLIKLFGNSQLSGDLLLKAENGSFVKISADASTLVGGARIDADSSAEFRLRDDSKWILSRPKNKSLQDSDAIGVSSISLIHLSNSSIVFEQSETNIVDGYQTLRVGRGTGEVYKAQGNARLYLNTYLNKGGALQDQKTDRLLIYGDVEGKTVVHVQSVAGSPGGGTGRYENAKGISVIQVSGKAEKDSFELDGDYIALGGLPYQYRLRAYGPGSELGEANISQRLVEGEGDFWDFRLENGIVDSDTTSRKTQDSRPSSHSKQGVKAVVPQVSNYLLLPNSILHTGLMDISNQNKQLEIQRGISNGILSTGANPASFLRGYGGSYRYTSDLSVFEYGYEGDLGYQAVEAGLLLQKIENADSVVSFGVMGSYGKLSLKPLGVTQSQESTFDKWTATAYGSIQCDAGFYVDGLLSYGLFKGDVSTLARGKTATLKGNPLSVSLTGGQTIATRYEGFVFDPQVQVIYQHLQFDKSHDIDGFDIEMGRLNQWVARVGGRLSKSLSMPEKRGNISLYGKLHLAHSFGEKKSVRFKDVFHLGAFGSSLEAGFGFNAQFTQKFALNADLAYQHKLAKGGFSGISFSGGVRYRF